MQNIVGADSNIKEAENIRASFNDNPTNKNINDILDKLVSDPKIYKSLELLSKT